VVKIAHKMWPEGQEMQCIFIKEFEIDMYKSGELLDV